MKGGPDEGKMDSYVAKACLEGSFKVLQGSNINGKVHFIVWLQTEGQKLIAETLVVFHGFYEFGTQPKDINKVNSTGCVFIIGVLGLSVPNRKQNHRRRSSNYFISNELVETDKFF